jgi:hypothetical protein
VVVFPGASSVALSSVNNGNSLPIWAVIGAIAGVFLFVQGFRMLRLKRIILNTPASKVRSASMGLVEVTGMANGPSTIPAGITGEACFYYRAVASQVKQVGSRREWKTVADERLFIPFFVEDSTGEMLVNPQGADLDLHSNFKDEIGSSFYSSGSMVPENISNFLARHGIVTSTAVRLEEWCIKPSDPMFVLGTLGKRTVESEWLALPHSPGTSVAFSFSSGLAGFSGRNQDKLVNSISFIPGVNVQFGLSRGSVRVTPIAQSLPAAQVVQAPAPIAAAAVWKSVSWEEGTAARATLAAAAERKAAAAAAAAPPADALGVDAHIDSQTAVGLDTDAPTESPADASQSQNAQFGMASTVEIGKGASGQPFFISYRSQREVARSFAWKSALYIWGGPILTLASLYFLSEYFNWM